jgi:hypothetical protein
VLTRGTAACVFGSVLFWLLAWGINYGTIMVRALPNGQLLSSTGRALSDFAYWIMPKPIDFGFILFQVLDARAHFAKPSIFEQLETTGSFDPILSCVSSLLITGVFLALSVRELNQTDY